MNNKYLSAIEETLPTLLPSEDCAQASVVRAMRYSLLAAGKRLRPTLTLAFCELCGGSYRNAVPSACAVEMIHAYSLIHDDLPCMDNDDLRRGKPSNHIVFGEDIALLAGDALQALAFDTLLSPSNIEIFGTKAAVAAGELAGACGARGMVGGQVIDLETEDKEPPLELITEMYAKKTGALICASCAMGCILAGASDCELAAARTYAEKLGLAFQIVDDILDVTSTTAALGKRVGSDAQNGKNNYVTMLGIDKARAIVDELTSQAVDALNSFDGDTAFLSELVTQMARRVY